MALALEALVRQRAEARCEDCHFPEALAEVPFQFDHIMPRQHGGQRVADNLALSCCYCNRYKGPNLPGVDPLTQEVTPLFHPRLPVWPEHFQWKGPLLVGKTAIGRATIQTLEINRHDAIAVRELLLTEGTFPVP